MPTNKTQSPPEPSRPPGGPTSPPPPRAKTGGSLGPAIRPRLRQLELISAILFEVDRQGVKSVSWDELQVIREAADAIVAAVGRDDPTTEAGDAK